MSAQNGHAVPREPLPVLTTHLGHSIRESAAQFEKCSSFPICGRGLVLLRFCALHDGKRLAAV